MGNQYIDRIELICWSRSLAAFGRDSNIWSVDVQLVIAFLLLIEIQFIKFISKD